MGLRHKMAKAVSSDNGKGNGKLAVILVRGVVKVTKPVKDTLTMLNLNRKNHCVVIENNSAYRGMLFKVKDYITWGNVDDNTVKELVEKRGAVLESDKKGLEFNGKKYKRYFVLNSPKKGFGEKGIKTSFKVGGGLGNRGDKIKDLIQRML
mgnify:FL=1